MGRKESNQTKQTKLSLIIIIYTLENQCTQTAQSSVDKRTKSMYLAIKKGNNFVNIFFSENNYRELLSLINSAVYLLNKMFVG